MADVRKEAVRVSEATRIARDVRVGGRAHRVEIILEATRGGRYCIDAIPVTANDFDRVLRLAALIDTGIVER